MPFQNPTGWMAPMRERRAGADLVPGGAPGTRDEPPRDCRQRPSNSDVFTDAWHQHREASYRVNSRSASHMPSRGRTNASPLFEIRRWVIWTPLPSDKARRRCHLGWRAGIARRSYLRMAKPDDSQLSVHVARRRSPRGNAVQDRSRPVISLRRRSPLLICHQSPIIWCIPTIKGHCDAVLSRRSKNHQEAWKPSRQDCYQICCNVGISASSFVSLGRARIQPWKELAKSWSPATACIDFGDRRHACLACSRT